MRFGIRPLVFVLLFGLPLSPISARAIELAAGTVTVQGLAVPNPESIQLSVLFQLCCPGAVLFDGVIVGAEDVGRTFRVTRGMDPVNFDRAAEQLMNQDPFNWITFQVRTQDAFGGVRVLEQTVTDAELFPPWGDFTLPRFNPDDPARILTAFTLRLDDLTLTDTPFGRQLSATLTLGVEGTSPGMGISLSAASVPESVAVGESFAHILTVRNDDTVAAGAVELTFGPEASVNGVTSSHGSCGPSPFSTGYVCDLGSLASGVEATVRIDQSAGGPGYYQTNATAVDHLPPPPMPPPQFPSGPSDPVPSMSPGEPRRAFIVTRAVNPVSLDLSVTKFGTEVSPGVIGYTLRIVNPGPVPATWVRVSEPLPEGEGLLFGLQSTMGPWFCRRLPEIGIATEVVCDTGSMPAPGFPAFLNYSRWVGGTPPGTHVPNRVTVTSLELDPVPGNNVATADVVVGAPADLAGEVLGPTSPTTPGTPVTYTLRVTNLGPSPATSILVDHPVDPSTVVSVGGPGWTCLQPPAHCTRASLGVGESADVTVTVSPSGGLLEIFGFARASNLDPNDGNNGLRATISVVAAPTAHAGMDQTVSEGALVTLDGTASTGEALTFAWEQTAGTFGTDPVVLSDVTSMTPTFMAPILTGGFGSQVLTFRVTVRSFNLSATDTVNVTVKNVNHAPVASAGVDQLVSEGSAVTLQGGSSYDPDGEALTFSWVQLAGPPVTLQNPATASPTFSAPVLQGGLGEPETLVFGLTVRDGSGADALSHTDDVEVKVDQENHAPVAAAGGPETRHEGTVVTLNGTGSGDPDGDPITYAWTQIDGTPVGLSDPSSASPSFTAPSVDDSMALTFRLVVSDSALTSSAQVVITVLSVNAPPQCDLAQAVPAAVLWPPDHKLLPVSIGGVSDPNDDRVTIRITGVTQDEPVDGTGDADTSPDAVVQDGGVHLRAERASEGNGRVYRVAFTADDGLAIGGTCQGAVTVGVPVNLQPGTQAIDDGQLHDATTP